MTDDKDYIKQLESAEPPTNNQDKVHLQLSMRFNYRQAIGELIFAMVTCRPDISYPLIKLSQYSANPAHIHYEAVINIFRYLHTTIDDGLIFWRKESQPTLADMPLPTVYKDNYAPTERMTHDELEQLHAIVDSDWAGDTTHR